MDEERRSPGPLRGFGFSGAPEGRLYLCPTGLLRYDPDLPPDMALPLAGGPIGFTAVRLLAREPDGAIRETTGPLAALEDWAEQQGADVTAHVHTMLTRITTRREAFAGLRLDRTRIMGVVNVTPDSFSDGGDYGTAEPAIAHGRALHEAGADILDIGGESTRPGAAPVDATAECGRVLPVIAGLTDTGAALSIDSRRAAVMSAAHDAGCTILNDVTALGGDPDSLGVAAKPDASVVLMHMQGEPQTMQQAPRYTDAALDVYDFLAGRIAACNAAGILPIRIAVDPGIGFGKTVAHNLRILDRLALFHGLGCALVVGVSRKSFIGKLSKGEPAKERLPGSLAAGLAAVARGAQILRVHDVAETRQALSLWAAIDDGPA